MAEETATQAMSVGQEVTGTVKKIGIYGALVDVGTDQQALLHISQLGKSVRHASEVLNEGDSVTAYVLRIDDKGIALTMDKPPAVPWESIVVGSSYNGEVVRIEKFGAFVDIGAERSGMVHVSEMADGYVKSPEEVVKVGDSVEVRVLRLNRRNRQIDLTMKTEAEIIPDEMDEPEETLTAMEIAFQRAQSSGDDNDDNGSSTRKLSESEKRRREQEEIMQRMRGDS